MIKTKPWVGGTDEEYEAQLFSFGAQRLKIAMRQMIEEKITTGVKNMESQLQESLDLNDTDKTTLTHSCDKLIRLYCDRANSSLDEIDNEIERMLKVPANVLLPEDEVQLQQVSDEEHERLKKEVADLRKRVERGVLMETLLTAEEEQISSIEHVCETAKKDMDVLDLMFKKSNSGSLKTIQNESEFLCETVPFMKQSKEALF